MGGTAGAGDGAKEARLSMSPERPISGIAAMLRASRKSHHAQNVQQQSSPQQPNNHHDETPAELLNEALKPRMSLDVQIPGNGRPISPGGGRGAFRFASLKIRSPKNRAPAVSPLHGSMDTSNMDGDIAGDNSDRTPEAGEPPLSPTIMPDNTVYHPPASPRSFSPIGPLASSPHSQGIHMGSLMKRLPSVSGRRGSGGNLTANPQSPSRVLSNSSLLSNRIPSSDSIRSGIQGGSTPLSASSSAHSLLSTSPSRRTSTSMPEVKETQKLVRDFDPSTGNKMINRYMIVKELGRGVHGKVKLSVDVETGDLWAIKIVEKQARRRFQNRLALSQRMANSADGEDVVNPQLEKIKREIAILKKLDHPHVVKLREVIDDPQAEKIYLVLEYLAGRDIKWQDRSDPPKPCLTLEESRRILRDVVCGLQYLHHQGIVHRDIKPANLLWTAEKRVKISDFGVSVFVDSGRNDDPASKKPGDELELAKTAGSPAFFAPELCAVPDEEPETIFRDNYPNDIETLAYSPKTPRPLSPTAANVEALGIAEPNVGSRSGMNWLHGFRRHHHAHSLESDELAPASKKTTDTDKYDIQVVDLDTPPTVSRTISSPGTSPLRRRSAFAGISPSSPLPNADPPALPKPATRRHSQPNDLNFPYAPPVPPPPIPSQYQNHKKSKPRKSLHDESVVNPMAAGSAIDVWALGVSLFCFVYGKVPFIADTEFELFHVICRQPLHFPIEPVVDDQLKDLIAKLLDKNPETRLKLHEVKLHPWTTADMTGSERAQWLRETDPGNAFGSPLSVTAEEVSSAVHVLFMDKIREKFRKLSTGLQSAFGFKKRTKSLPSVASDASDNLTTSPPEITDLSMRGDQLAPPTMNSSQAIANDLPPISPLSPFSPMSISDFITGGSPPETPKSKRLLHGSRESGIEIILETLDKSESDSGGDITHASTLAQKHTSAYLTHPTDDDDDDFDSSTDGQPSPATTWIRWGEPIDGQPSWMSGVPSPKANVLPVPEIPDDAFVEMIVKEDETDERRRRWHERARRMADMSSLTSLSSSGSSGVSAEDGTEEEGHKSSPHIRHASLSKSIGISRTSGGRMIGVGPLRGGGGGDVRMGEGAMMLESRGLYTSSPSSVTPAGSAPASRPGTPTAVVTGGEETATHP
ncbi:hypothetical protein HDU67_007378 [Dinochytrium kinnereticum]|nr:hypothetical protein HDU67_007378 [Dinochytrium kinnereticum]